MIPEAPNRAECKAAVLTCHIPFMLPFRGEVYTVSAWDTVYGLRGHYMAVEVNNRYLKFEEVHSGYCHNVMWQTWQQLRKEGRAKFLHA